ncbi:hypothetical protein HDU81_003570 [Chytriomyces hyalinus]|nr:hypothetical protein HDU81_003570 [Chytriomyces hyalinus]
MKDVLGTSDICNCLGRASIEKDPILSYLLPHETAYIMFKSGKETHLFPDLAYVSIKGVTAGISRRYLDRIEYTEAPMSDVCFETAGYGITDRDVELKFAMACVRATLTLNAVNDCLDAGNQTNLNRYLEERDPDGSWLLSCHSGCLA